MKKAVISLPSSQPAGNLQVSSREEKKGEDKSLLSLHACSLARFELIYLFSATPNKLCSISTRASLIIWDEGERVRRQQEEGGNGKSALLTSAFVCTCVPLGLEDTTGGIFGSFYVLLSKMILRKPFGEIKKSTFILPAGHLLYFLGLLRSSGPCHPRSCGLSARLSASAWEQGIMGKVPWNPFLVHLSRPATVCSACDAGAQNSWRPREQNATSPS